MSDDLSLTQENIAASAKENFEASKSHALQAAEELRAAASGARAKLLKEAEARAQHFKEIASGKASQFKDAAEEKVDHVREVAGTSWEDAKVKAKDFHMETEAYVRENPTKAVLTALGVGFVIGLIFRR